MLVNIAPVHRSPMDKDGGRALNDYTKKLEKLIDGLVPWKKRRGWARGLAKGSVKPGEVVVVLDQGDVPNDPLFEGARTTRE